MNEYPSLTGDFIDDFRMQMSDYMELKVDTAINRNI